jgi:hypothetical protein
MCGACGFPAVPGHWTEAGVGDSAHDRLRARFRRAQVLRSVLRAYGLTVRESLSSPGIQVCDMGGAQLIVPDMTELWKAAERLGSRRIDPLDPFFTESPSEGAQRGS